MSSVNAPRSEKRKPFKDQNFLLMIFYEGPWERVQALCYGIRRNGSVRWNIPVEPSGAKKLLELAATWCEQRDAIWRAKHILKRKDPHKRWSRKCRDDDNT